MTTTLCGDGASAEERKHLLNMSMLKVGSRRCSRAGLSRAYVREERLDDVEVSNLCAAERWELEPNNEDALEGEVPGNVVEEDGEGERLKEVEKAEHGPVGEPLDVVVCRWALNSLK